MVRVLLEGRPGIGKTTVARRCVELLTEAGVSVRGFRQPLSQWIRSLCTGFLSIFLPATPKTVDEDWVPATSGALSKDP